MDDKPFTATEMQRHYQEACDRGDAKWQALLDRLVLGPLALSTRLNVDKLFKTTTKKTDA